MCSAQQRAGVGLSRGRWRSGPGDDRGADLVLRTPVWAAVSPQPGGEGPALCCPGRGPDGTAGGPVVSRLRPIAEPFPVAAPAGARIRTRLRTHAADDAVLLALGSHLGTLAGRDLARRCSEGPLEPRATAASRRLRKQP